jgi:hypothetical protein
MEMEKWARRSYEGESDVTKRTDMRNRITIWSWSGGGVDQNAMGGLIGSRCNKLEDQA